MHSEFSIISLAQKKTRENVEAQTEMRGKTQKMKVILKSCLDLSCVQLEQNANLDFQGDNILASPIFSITSQKTCENAKKHKKNRGKIKKMKVVLDV